MTTNVGQVVGIIIDKPDLQKACSITALKLAYSDDFTQSDVFWKWDISSLSIFTSQYLNFPQAEVMTIDSDPEISTEGKQEEESTVDPEFLPFAELPQVEALEVMDISSDDAHKAFDGSGCLSSKEKNEVLNIDCKTTVKDLSSLFELSGDIQTFEYPN